MRDQPTTALVQKLQKLFRTERIIDRVRRILPRSLHKVVAISERKKGGIRPAALMLGVGRVATAAELRRTQERILSRNLLS
jgi:glutamate dehydrogenase/leucine dehydrogenase